MDPFRNFEVLYDPASNFDPPAVTCCECFIKCVRHVTIYDKDMTEMSMCMSCFRLAQHLETPWRVGEMWEDLFEQQHG
jgi:hypothetical protein